MLSSITKLDLFKDDVIKQYAFPTDSSVVLIDRSACLSALLLRDFASRYINGLLARVFIGERRTVVNFLDAFALVLCFHVIRTEDAAASEQHRAVNDEKQSRGGTKRREKELGSVRGLFFVANAPRILEQSRA